MGATYQLLLGGQAADPGFYTDVTSIEVEESMDLPGAMELHLPVVATESGDLTYVSDARLQPFSSLTILVTPPGDSSTSGLSGLLGGGGGAPGMHF
jgi:hypothetical protein